MLLLCDSLQVFSFFRPAIYTSAKQKLQNGERERGCRKEKPGTYYRHACRKATCFKRRVLFNSKRLCSRVLVSITGSHGFPGGRKITWSRYIIGRLAKAIEESCQVQKKSIYFLVSASKTYLDLLTFLCCVLNNTDNHFQLQ